MQVSVLLLSSVSAQAYRMQELLSEADRFGSSFAATFEFEYAARVPDGLERLAKRDVDAVLFDLALLDDQGLDGLTEVQARAPQVPIIALAETADPALATRVLRLGVQDCVLDDQLDRNTLPRVLLHAIERQRAQQIALAEGIAQIERAKQEWESTADSLPQLICLLDSQGRVIRANRVVESWQLCAIQDVRGYYLHELLHRGCTDERCALRTFWHAAWDALLTGEIVASEYQDSILDRYLSIQARPIAFSGRDDRAAKASLAVVIVDDITERKRAEEALHQRTAQLQARNEELDAFAHTVAHDLKNPISLMIGYADILRQYRKSTPDADIESNLDTIVQNGLKTISIIDELLLLAGVRQVEITPAPVDMDVVIDNVLRRLAMLIRERNAQIARPSGWPMTVGYAPWIEEVWANYVSNAIKYGGQPPRAELGATPQPDRTIRFWVRDNGQGIGAEQQKRLFAPFTRLDHGRASGHGLGLSIVRRIVARMGGQVGVESQTGRGSEFYFTLPDQE